MTALIKIYPNEATRNIDMIVIGTPVTKKSFTFKYCIWKSSTINNELKFGNDENGKAIAAEIANAEPMTVICGIPKFKPICKIIGSKIIAATVWETNVAIVPAKNKIQTNANHTDCNGNAIVQYCY